MSKTVRYEVDLNNLPPLTEAQKAEIETLAAMPDDQIDTSDIPELGEAFWKNAVRGRFYKPTKTATTVRVECDPAPCHAGRSRSEKLNRIKYDGKFSCFDVGRRKNVSLCRS